MAILAAVVVWWALVVGVSALAPAPMGSTEIGLSLLLLLAAQVVLWRRIARRPALRA